MNIQKSFKQFLTNTLFFTLFVSFSGNLSAQNATITDPATDGFSVQNAYVVQGTADVPDGAEAWILVHRSDYELWYPQGMAKVMDGSNWKRSCYFGQGIDIGWDFEIAVILVNKQEHAKLNAYLRRAMSTGDWRPIPMPRTLAAPVIRRVHKVGHGDNDGR